ncbi:MAG: hypothetical protein COA83_02635 [Methylophaga sp.]|nr:MAG: hypothetical protein COA83_02635 [Methylophaga sp.]
MSDKKGEQLSKLQVFSTLLFSLFNTALASLLLSIYWPAEAIERMAAAGLFLPVFWIIFLLVGFLSRNMKHALAWQSGILLVFSAVIVNHFI